LQSHDLSFFDFSLDLLPEDIFGIEEILSTSSPIPQLKKKMPCTSRRPTISSAVAFGI
jgi:hypothetical protein